MGGISHMSSPPELEGVYYCKKCGQTYTHRKKAPKRCSNCGGRQFVTNDNYIRKIPTQKDLAAYERRKREDPMSRLFGA